MRKIFGYLWYHQSDRNYVWNILEWGSIFGSHYKTSAGLDKFLYVFGFRDDEEDDDSEEAAHFLSLASSSCFGACIYDECRAANPGQEEDDGKGAKLIYYLMLLCALLCLCV